MEIKITKLMSEDCGQYSGSQFELGNEAARITWRNSLNDHADFIELTDDQIEEARDWFGEFGAWDDDERAEWTRDEVCALVFQEIAARIREIEDIAMGDDGEIDWDEVERASEAGSISGMIYKHENEVYAYIGN